MTKVSGVGRPSVVTESVVALLINAFSHGMTDEQACIYAGIGKNALYNYCEKNKSFTNQKELLKHKPSMKAKLNLSEKIEAGDIDVSKWRSERKNKDEFSLRSETTGAGGGPILTQEIPLTEQQKKIIAKQVLDKLDNIA